MEKPFRPHCPGSKKGFTTGRSQPPTKDSDLEMAFLLSCEGRPHSLAGRILELQSDVQPSIGFGNLH